MRSRENSEPKLGSLTFSEGRYQDKRQNFVFSHRQRTFTLLLTDSHGANSSAEYESSKFKPPSVTSMRSATDWSHWIVFENPRLDDCITSAGIRGTTNVQRTEC